MKLYHGSNTSIDAIDLKRGRRGKDFGQGFYLTLTAVRHNRWQNGLLTVKKLALPY